MEDVEKEKLNTTVTNKEIEEKPTLRSSRNKRYIFKRPTTLKLEGDFFFDTENTRQFIEYALAEKRKLCRKPTILKLSGTMESNTETREKFKPYEEQLKPLPLRRHTNLKLEGTLSILSENREKYIPYEIYQRVPFQKQNTTLHLEGDLFLEPEYQNAYTKHEVGKTINQEIKSNFQKDPRDLTTIKQEPLIPFLRKNSLSQKQANAKQILKISNTDQISPPKEVNKEYYNFYKDAYGNFGKAKTLNKAISSTTKDTRNLNSLRNLQKTVPNRTTASNANSNKEKKLRFPRQQKPIKIEGPFECQPEYRKAYVDYIMREKLELQSRPLLHTKNDILASDKEKQNEIEDYVPSISKMDNTFVNEPRISAVSTSNPTTKEGLNKIETCLLGPKVSRPNQESKRNIFDNRQRKISQNKSFIVLGDLKVKEITN